MTEKLRFAQAGVSLMHANMYRDTLMLLQDELELVGFYDPDPEAVRPNLKAEVQHVPFYDSLGDLLTQAKPDAVMVSTYLKDMPAWMLEVAEAGVHVWGEKPFAVHSSQLLPVAEAVRRKGLHFSCGYTWRFHPIARLINETWAAGLLGKPTRSSSASLLRASAGATRRPGISAAKARAGASSTGWVATGLTLCVI